MCWNRWSYCGRVLVYRDRDGCVTYSIGPHFWFGTLFTVFVIIGGYLLFLRVLARSSYSIAIPLWWTLVIGEGVLALLALYYLMGTALVDAGIVYWNILFAIPSTVDDVGPYCDICDINQNRRLRVQHCLDCNVCVEGYDHHCPVSLGMLRLY